MDQQIFLWELAFLSVWLTAPAQIVMLVVLSLWGTVRVYLRDLSALVPC
jgi:hypothetical protein